MTRFLITMFVCMATVTSARADVSVKITGRFGMFWNGGFGTENRMRLDFKSKTVTDDGLTFGGFARASLESGSSGTLSGPYLYAEWDIYKLTIGNTSGAVGTQLAVWGCAAGYRGSSCADMVANLSPGGWTPVFTTSSSTGQGPNLLRFNAKFPDVKLAVSGGNGNDFEIAAAFKLGKVKVGLGFDDGSGIEGGWTLVTETKLGDVTYGLDVGRYGSFTNVVAQVQLKKGVHTYYAYASSLGGTASYGISYKQDLGGGVKFGTGLEMVGGSWLADMGVSISF